MSKLQKPKTIYRKQLPTELFPPKPFSYAEEQPLNRLTIIWYGLLGRELTPKNFRKYENFMSEARIYILTALVEYILIYSIFHSSFITETGVSGDYKYEPTYFDYVIDFCIEQYDRLKNSIKF